MTKAGRVFAHIGIGSNVADPHVQVTRAVRELEILPSTRLMRVSSFYDTDPVGFSDQPRFVNAVAIIQTSLLPRELLDGLLDIEQRHGRMREVKNAVKNGPRTLDLDILLYAHLQMREEGLSIPHPRMHERGFVLEPLLEIDPDCAIPGLGPALQYRAQTMNQGVTKIDP